MEYVTLFAETGASTGSGGIFEALGIDLTTLVLQIIAFLILVALLGKFVYPVLIKAVDDRQKKIDESVEAADTAKQKAEEADKKIEALLHSARKEAGEIVATAREQATVTVDEAEKKARQKADHIVSEAHAEIEKDIASAKKQLYNETIDLVAAATEKVVGKQVSATVDDTLIKDSVRNSA